MAPQLAATWGDGGVPVVLLHGGLVSDPVRHWSAVKPLADQFQLRVAVLGEGAHLRLRV